MGWDIYFGYIGITYGIAPLQLSPLIKEEPGEGSREPMVHSPYGSRYLHIGGGRYPGALLSEFLQRL